jgi:hypothetical protein
MRMPDRSDRQSDTQEKRHGRSSSEPKSGLSGIASAVVGSPGWVTAILTALAFSLRFLAGQTPAALGGTSFWSHHPSCKALPPGRWSSHRWGSPSATRTTPCQGAPSRSS